MDESSRVSLAHRLFVASVKLQLPNTTGVYSIVLMHRYLDYFEKSSSSLPSSRGVEKDEDLVILLGALIFLASKLTESCRRIRDVCNIARWVYGATDLLNIADEKYYALREAIIHKEQVILRVLGFMMWVDLPHGYLLEFGQKINLNPQEMCVAWSLLNDSYLCRQSLDISLDVLVCACLEASRHIVAKHNQLIANGLPPHNANVGERLLRAQSEIEKGPANLPPAAYLHTSHPSNAVTTPKPSSSSRTKTVSPALPSSSSNSLFATPPTSFSPVCFDKSKSKSLNSTWWREFTISDDDLSNALDYICTLHVKFRYVHEI